MELFRMYHGTTDVFAMERILPPLESGNLREEWRKKIRDKVFVTPSLLSAKKFARKAAEKYGGSAIIYEVRPHGQVDNINTNEYICDYADIVGVAERYVGKWV